ncbi:MAG TPA: thiamine phosphate synthase [Thermoanaerobaculia bacterium]|nr:thiamine phosphate synthase [Thermoanaerobaculia bacterium]
MGAVYAIADAGVLGAEALPAAVAEMAGAGIRWIQVRAKHLSGSGWHAALAACCRELEGSGVRLWVDDRADLAALFPVEGVHVGQRDLPPAAARRVVGGDVRIGLSTHDEEQFAAADADPEVDVIAVGPVFPTTGKEDPDPVVGLPFVRWARERTRKPLVAIGGIDAGNVAAVLAAGADAAAVLGAVCRGGVREVRANCLRLMIAARAAGLEG